MSKILNWIINFISEKFSRTSIKLETYNYQKYLELEKQYKLLSDANFKLLMEYNELKKENKVLVDYEDLKKENIKLKNEKKSLLIELDELQKNYNYLVSQVENKPKNELISDKDFYGILENDLTIKKIYLEYFISCNYKYYLVLGFPFTYENKNEIQEKVFRKYMQGLRERRGKDKRLNKIMVEIKYIWTREKGKMKRTHYNILINNINITEKEKEYESKKWLELLKNEKLINEIELWHPTMYYIDSIYSINNFLNSKNKEYIFKEFNIEKTELEKNVSFIGVDLETKKYLEKSKYKIND